MQANPPGAEPSAALRQPEHGQDQRSPQRDGRQQGDQQTNVERFGSGGGRIQRASTLLPLVVLGITQLVWVAALGYATFSMWQRLPF